HSTGDVKNGLKHSGIKKAMDEKYHTWHKNFVYLPVYLTGGSSQMVSYLSFLFILNYISI
ncbi:hypothetical protein, partial [Aerococcus urinaeequi]|uniref:hypothetical protein n=1 Tax=Aerococcus urinaeequi TaxID=51665 RepID=UPI003EC610E5